MLMRMPYWLKLRGKMIMEEPTMELAMATPVMKTDLPIGIIIYFVQMKSLNHHIKPNISN